MAHAGLATKLDEVGLEREHDVSLYEKPTPVTVTNVPTPPLAGFSTMKGAVTVKVVSTKSPDEPVTRTVYGPGPTVPTTKLPVKLPPVEPEMTQLDPPNRGAVIVVMLTLVVRDVVVLVVVGAVNEQPVSLALSEPVTLTIVPCGPVVGLIVIAVTTKVVWALMKRSPSVILRMKV